MHRLNEEQMKKYAEQGFLVVDSVFTEEELRDVNEEVDRLQKIHEGKSANEGWIQSLHEHSDKTNKLAEDPRLLSLLEDIVKPGIAIYSLKLTAKMPHSHEVCHWHQDDAYYNKVSESQTRMSVWIPLQEANTSNGCLWVVPVSHKGRLMPHERKDYGQCRLSFDESEVDVSKAIPVEVPAGSVVLFSAKTWHHSKGNSTDQMRRAFIISYQETTVSGGRDGQWRIVKEA
jgi:phytanoyl-CoA hydroxylase